MKCLEWYSALSKRAMKSAFITHVVCRAEGPVPAYPVDEKMRTDCSAPIKMKTIILSNTHCTPTVHQALHTIVG